MKGRREGGGKEEGRKKEKGGRRERSGREERGREKGTKVERKGEKGSLAPSALGKVLFPLPGIFSLLYPALSHLVLTLTSSEAVSVSLK